MGKKGVPPIVVIVGILVIAVVGGGTYFYFNSLDDREFEVQEFPFMLTIKEQSVLVDESPDKIKIVLEVERGPGEGKLDEIRFIIENEDGSFVSDQVTVLKTQGEQSFTITGPFSKPKKISIIPVITKEDGSKSFGNVAHTYDFETGKSIVENTEEVIATYSIHFEVEGRKATSSSGSGGTGENFGTTSTGSDSQDNAISETDSGIDNETMGDTVNDSSTMNDTVTTNETNDSSTMNDTVTTNETLVEDQVVNETEVSPEQNDTEVPPEEPPVVEEPPLIKPELFFGEYFNNKNLEGDPVLIRENPEINFDWKRRSPDSSVNKDKFSARWTRPEFFEGGVYNFYVKSDDGFRMYIDGELYANYWGAGKAIKRGLTFDKEIEKGDHEVVVEYFENKGNAFVTLKWDLSDFSRTVVSEDGDLVVHLKAEDKSVDGSALDSSGEGNHGSCTENKCPTYLPRKGINGTGAYEFDGKNDYLDLGTFDIYGDKLTLATWINSDNLASCSRRHHDCRIITKSTTTREQSHYWMLSTIKVGSEDRLRFRLKTDGDTELLIADSGVITENEWFHAAAVYDGENMLLYLNGIEVGRKAKTGTIDTNPDVRINVGRNPNGYGEWDGLIDDVRIYDRSLTQEEIAILAMNPFSICGNGLLEQIEECDDGNPLSGDGCSAICEIELEEEMPILAKDPVLHLKAKDDLKDQTATDSSENRNDGTCFGTRCPTYLPTGNQINSSSYDFDGKDDSLLITGAPSLDFGGNAFTIATWTKPANTRKDDVLIVKETWDYALEIDQNGGEKFDCYYDGGAQRVKAKTKVDYDVWQHVACVYDGSTFKIYINGTEDNSVSSDKPLTSTGDDVFVGRDVRGGQYYKGSLNDLRVYDRALSEEEIKNLLFTLPAPVINSTNVTSNNSMNVGGCISDLDCNDGNPCTDNVCLGGSCGFIVDNSNRCTLDTEGECVIGASCNNGQCLVVSNPDACAGARSCSTVICNPDTGYSCEYFGCSSRSTGNIAKYFDNVIKTVGKIILNEE